MFNKKVKLPFVVYEITSNCNLNCRYCYNIWKRSDKTISEHSQYNSYKHAKKTLKKLFTLADVDIVTMSGGEPFMGERFSELVLFTRMKSKLVYIISNGNKASTDDYKQMLDMGVSVFEFPIHSHKADVHDYLTQVEGSHSKSVNSVKTVLENGGNAICVIVITKSNYDHIKDTLEFIKKLGIKNVMLNRFNIGGKGISEYENIKMDLKQLRKAFKDAHDFASDNRDMKLTSNVCTPFCILDPKDHPLIKMSSCSATTENMPITIDISGNVRLCNHSPVIIGNIYKDSFDDMFNSEYPKKWKGTVPEYCIDCNRFDLCQGGCRAASEQLGLGIDKVDPAVIEYLGIK